MHDATLYTYCSQPHGRPQQVLHPVAVRDAECLRSESRPAHERLEEANRPVEESKARRYALRATQQRCDSKTTLSDFQRLNRKHSNIRRSFRFLIEYSKITIRIAIIRIIALLQGIVRN